MITEQKLQELITVCKTYMALEKAMQKLRDQFIPGLTMKQVQRINNKLDQEALAKERVVHEMHCIAVEIGIASPEPERYGEKVVKLYGGWHEILDNRRAPADFTMPLENGPVSEEAERATTNIQNAETVQQEFPPIHTEGGTLDTGANDSAETPSLSESSSITSAEPEETAPSSDADTIILEPEATGPKGRSSRSRKNKPGKPD